MGKRPGIKKTRGLIRKRGWAEKKKKKNCPRAGELERGSEERVLLGVRSYIMHVCESRPT